jgi:hypothetical protein
MLTFEGGALFGAENRVQFSARYARPTDQPA